MKRVFALFLFVVFALSLVACNSTTTVDTTPMTAPETLTMAEVDQYLFNSQFQFVDVRNFDDQMADGWIRGFEFIPFFDYLEYSNILVRIDGWNFSSNAIKDENALRGLFDEDKFIVIMCAGGTRAGFVRDALLELGYTNVYNVGGFNQYTGENKVLGDGTYQIVMQHPAMVNPLPAEITMDCDLFDYYAARKDVQLVDLRNLADVLTGWHRESQVIPFFTFLETSEILVRTDGDWTFAPEDIRNEEALRLLFDQNQNIILFCKSGTRAAYVKAALEHLGYTKVWNAGSIDAYLSNDGGNTGGGC